MTQIAAKSGKKGISQHGQEENLPLDQERNELRDAIFERLHFLWRRRRILQKAALVGMLFGIALAVAIPARYEATTQLMPPDNQSSSGLAMLAAFSTKTSNALAPMASDLLGMKSSGALFVGVLRSNTVEDRLIDRFNLHKVYGARYAQDARNALAGHSSIVEDRKSGIISITVMDHDPKRAAAIASAYVEELNQLVAQVSTSSARREREFLEERLVGVKHDLDQASQEFSQFASKNKTLDIKEEARAMLQGAASIEGQLIAAESELKGLQSIYTENNVRVQAVEARIAALRQQMDKLGGSSTGKPDASQDSTHPSLTTLPILGVTYADLYRRMQIQEAVYETLTQQYELAKVQEAKEIPSVKVLDPATVPDHKSFPPRLIVIFICICVAVAAIAAVLLAKDHWRKIDAADSGKLFAQEVFQSVNATMPWATPNGSRVQAWSNRLWVKLIHKKSSEEQNEPDDSSRN